MASLSTSRPALLIVVLGALVVTGLSTPVGAQGTGSLELVAQSAWVDDGGIFDLQVRVAGADPESSVVLRAYAPWPERDNFLRLDLAGREPVLELEPIPLADLQITSNEVLSLQLELAGPNSPTRDVVDETDAELDDDVPPIDVLETEGGSAVHPIEILLLDPDGNIADSFVTSLIELPRGERTVPLRTTIILEADLPGGLRPDGTISLDETSTEEIAIFVDAITNHPNAAVALSVSPESLVSLQRLGSDAAIALLETMRTQLVSDQLLPNPYVDIDEQAWVNTELTEALRSLYAAGALASTEVIGVAPEPAVMLLDRTINGDGLDALADLGAQGVIVRPAQLVPLDKETFPQALTTKFLLPSAGGRTVPALVADGGLSNHFTNPGGPVYNANRLLADLTLLSMQNIDVRQAAVVHPPNNWEADAKFLNILLSGIERIPAITGASPLEALSGTAFTPAQGIGTLSPPLRRELRPRRLVQPLGSFRTEYNQARAAIESWSSVITGDDDSSRLLVELLMVSTDVDHMAEDRSAYINAIYTLIDQQKSGSITTPKSDTITLTGREAEIPIVVENNLGVDASVILLLESEKLAFPNGAEVAVLLAPGPNRIDVAIEARAAGDSPIRIQVFSPDRSILLGSSNVLVRTLAFSGVGIVIGGAAILVLMLWWLRHVRSSRDTVETLPAAEAATSTEEPLGV